MGTTTTTTMQGSRAIRLERWRPLIDGSRTEEALAAVMRQYCDTLLPSDLARLPESSPTCAVNSVADIGELAVLYTAIDLKYTGGDDEARAMLSDLALTFCAAAEQLKKLRHPMLHVNEKK